MNVGFFIFPDFQLLDLSGPLAAFEIAKRFHGAESYRLHTVSLKGGIVNSSSGIGVESMKLDDLYYDTLVIIGGDRMETVCQCERTRNALMAAATRARRVSSICTGVFLMAETGLLCGRRVTTHWRFAEEFQRKHPGIIVEGDRIFVRDGRFWSSAGITAGIDLALALIEEDFGEETARKVACDLVVYYRRPGGQSQYSALLETHAQSERIALIMAHIRENLDKQFRLEELATKACLSPRQFTRVFKEETGKSPAKAIEFLRVEAARIRIENNPSQGLEEIAGLSGFRNLESMRRAFLRQFGQPPQALRRSVRARS